MIKKFKFLTYKKISQQELIFVEYTSEYNGKLGSRLRFYADEEYNLDCIEFNGTFLQFKRMIENHPNLDWYSNDRKPLIYMIHFYSPGMRNYQRRGDLNYFRRNNVRFKKNQQLRIFYEII